MGTVNVRRLDDAVVERLKARAAANNRSLEGEVRDILERAAVEEDMAEKVRAFRELARELRKKTRGVPQIPPSEVLIRQDRDGGHFGGHREV